MARLLIAIDAIFVLLYVAVMAALYHFGKLPVRLGTFELLVLGLAVARLSDIICTDQIMQWLREPFVEMETEEIAGQQVRTRTGRGRGLKKVFGDLLSCPWCVGVWMAAGLTYAYFLWPRVVWLFVLVMAIAEVGSLLQSFSTILVRVEKYMKCLGVESEEEV